MNMDNEIEKINSAVELWDFLQKKGGLDIKRYDTNITDELRLKLSLPPRGNFTTLLKTENISVEDLIVAFFQAVQPYAEMMSDILTMFESSGAKRSSRNLFIDFDFGKDLPELKFDLSHFKDWIETWNKIISRYIANLWNTNLLWKLNSVFRSDGFQSRNKGTSNQILYKWLLEYQERRRWPDFLLPAPYTGITDIDEKISRAWKVWEKVVIESSKYGKDRDILNEIAFKPMRDNSSDDEDRYQNGDRPSRFTRDIESRSRKNGLFDKECNYKIKDWPPELLGQIDSDYWAGSFAKGAYEKIEEISGLTGIEKKQEANELGERLDEIFNILPKIEVEGESLIREIEEFLSLPIWEKRHELYSVWISTQIVDVFKDNSLRIHQIDKTLTFSFSGTHFATIDDFLPRLHVWAELRSPLSKPVGKGRKKAIQPDYSLITDPITNPKSSIFEVECKQYLRPSRKKFAHALTDYARGRPNAHVVLVNYGKANDNILEDVDPKIRDRTSIIGEMKPNSISAQKHFKQTIKNSVRRRFGIIVPAITERVLLKESGLITLKWESEPLDLDLHLKISSSKDNFEISYSVKGNLYEKPYAQLDKDIQNGFGPENIKIKQWIGNKYHCAVKNYSGKPELAGCNAHIKFQCGKYEFELKCPNEGKGLWWDIFILDADSGEIKIINEIVESPW
jgi:hypothetical protein